MLKPISIFLGIFLLAANAFAETSSIGSGTQSAQSSFATSLTAALSALASQINSNGTVRETSTAMNYSDTTRTITITYSAWPVNESDGISAAEAFNGAITTAFRDSKLSGSITPSYSIRNQLYTHNVIVAFTTASASPTPFIAPSISLSGSSVGSAP